METSMAMGGRPLKLDRTVRVWGIDLGTTNSTVTEVTWSPDGGPSGKPEHQVLEVDQPTIEGVFSSPLVPSVVAVLPSGETWVGEGAKRLRARPQEAGLVAEKTLFFETKNEMGLKRSYHRAAPEFDRPHKIAGHILRNLCEAAHKATGAQPDRVVVTVPASFQLSQRMDTIEAARLAGLKLKAYDLMDEPVAALLAYLETAGARQVFTAGATSKVLVFDFGGGTCDVSIVEVTASPGDGIVQAASRAVSRYHRLGGGDLDAAVVHEVLIPALAGENAIGPGELSWAEKKRGLEPQLLGTAEALKIGMCREVDRLKKFGKYTAGDPSLIVRQPALECRLGGRTLALKAPCLSAERWEGILQPFLDTEALYARETEYRLTQSIFAPLQDALDRAKMKAREVDLVLLVGGSALIPQVRQALESFFSKARVAAFGDPMETQLAVSRGAALHAFCLEATGRPLIEPVAADGVALLTGSGDPLDLLRAGTPLPYPKDGSFARLQNLTVPATGAHDLRMEVVALPSKQVLLNEVWKMDGEAKRGDAMTLDYRFGANGKFECGAFLTARPDRTFHRTVENPLAATVSPHPTRLRIESMEEALRSRGGPGPGDCAVLVELARLYAELRQVERALDFLKTALRLINRPDAEILNLMGLYYSDLRDSARAEKSYLAAAEVSGSWDGPLFNLALSLSQKGENARAVEILDKALLRAPGSGPTRALKAQCLKAMGRETEAKAAREKAREDFGEPSTLSDWELGWYSSWAKSAGDEPAQREADAERARRSARGSAVPDGALRPEVPSGLKKRGE